MSCIPTTLQGIFNTSLRDKVLYELDESLDEKEGKGLVSTKELIGNIIQEKENNNETFLTLCKRSFVFFLCLDVECIILPSCLPPSKEAVNEFGHFWIAHEAKKNGSVYEYGICWDKIVLNKSYQEFLVDRLFLFINWFCTNIKLSDFSSSRKREACSIVFELLEIIICAGHFLNRIHLEWSIENELISIGQLQSVAETEFASFLIPTLAQKIFTENLSFLLKDLIHYGSYREAYVSFTGVLHNTELSLDCRLFILPFFAQVINKFSTKQASFLMSVNTTILSRILTESKFLQKAEQSLKECSDGKISREGCESSYKMSHIKFPFCLRWIIAASLYIVKYFEILGNTRVRKQSDDLYGVGPSSCSALLSKAILILGVTFNVSFLKNETCKMTNEFQCLNLCWDPLNGIISKDSSIQKYIQLFEKHAYYCLFKMVSWFVEITMASDGRFSFENTNTITPLTDGCGELELTPLSNALIASLCCFQQSLSLYTKTCHHCEIFHCSYLKSKNFLLSRNDKNCILMFFKNNKNKWIPLIISSQRLTQIGCINAFVLLTAGCTKLTDTSDINLKRSLLTCFLCNSSTSQLFSFRQRSVTNFGQTLFAWITCVPNGLRLTPNSIFDTVYGLSIRLHSLIHTVILALVNVYPSERPTFSNDILSLCNDWLSRYSFSNQLDIFSCLANSTKTLSIPFDMLGAYKIALIHLYKTQLAHYSLNTLHISSTDTVVLCNLVDDFCHMTISEEPLGQLEQTQQDAIVLEMLNVLKLILSSPNFSNAATKLRNDYQKEQHKESTLKLVLNQLTTRVDIERNLSMSGEAKFSQLVPYVLSDVRTLISGR